MAETRPRLVSYIYVSTRLRVRQASLFPLPVYGRLLLMSISEIALFLMQHGYGSGLGPATRSARSINVATACRPPGP